MKRKRPRRHVRRLASGKKVIVNKRCVPDKKVYNKWRGLVNMTPKELKSFVDSDEGKKAGLSYSKAKSLGIKSGRESAKQILSMKPKAKSFSQAKKNWSDEQWCWARRQNSFNSRMRGVRGPLFDKKGRRTRKHTALLIWGHDPTK